MTTDEKRAKGIPLDDIKPSQHRRANWQDYEDAAIYMVTIVIDGRTPLLGTLTGNFRAPRGTADFPHLVPSPLGRLILEQELPKIHTFYPQVEVWKATLMPDHLHLLLRVNATLPRGRQLGDVISGFKGGCSRAWWALQEAAAGTPAPQPPTAPTAPAAPAAPTTPITGPNGPATTAQESAPAGNSTTAQGSAPAGNSTTAQESAPAGNSAPAPNSTPAGNSAPAANSAPARNSTPAGNSTPAAVAAPFGAVPIPRRPLFEPGYHDRIIKRPGMLDTIKRYMADNPLRAIMRRQLPRLLERRLHLFINGREYAAFGGIFLLKRPEKRQVFFHRRDPQSGMPTELTTAYQKERAALLAEAREGVVLVSPAISKGERGVIDAALEERLPIIMLQKEPIGPYWKPERRRFEACATGNLLILAPWGLDEEIRRNTVGGSTTAGTAGNGSTTAAGACIASTAANAAATTAAISDYARFHHLNDLAEEICLNAESCFLRIQEIT
ncbi:MAG: hypothetical protein IJ142_03790 [Bacteroidaceae bacterium]|nr:hypothetical protein [Bacteroidaceae bacterium]